MPWRLIGAIIIIIIVGTFVGFNLGNVSTIHFGFFELPDVPVFLTIFASFVLGALFSIPYAIHTVKKARLKQEEKTVKEVQKEQQKLSKKQSRDEKRQKNKELKSLPPSDAPENPDIVPSEVVEGDSQAQGVHQVKPQKRKGRSRK